MRPPITNKTPIVAVTGSTTAADNELPTVAGAVPPALLRQLQTVAAPLLPEMCRLPRPRERDPIASASRTWLIETDATLPPNEKFLFRIRRRGKIRGAVFINVAKLLAFLQKAEAADKGGSK